VSTPFNDRLRYRFDTFMSRGGVSIFLALLTLFLLAFVVMSLVRVVTGLIIPDEAAGSLTDQLWRTFLQVTDAGAVAEDGDSGWAEKAVGIATIMVGLVLFSSLVAFITAEFEARLAELRKGHSKVIESGHTLILGIGDRAVEVVRELIVANESERDAAIVVLADLPKDEMDDFFAEKVGERKTTRVITRSGSTSSLPTLRRMGVARAQAVVVISGVPSSAPVEQRVRADAQVLKAIMAVVAASDAGRVPRIVAELHLDRNRSLAESIAPDFVTTLAEKELLARLLVQTSRTSGLAVVYGNLVGFVGNEIYFFRPPQGWAGANFGQLQLHFPQTVPIGFRTGSGDILLNPPADHRPADTDEAIVLAEDDGTIGYSGSPVAASSVTSIPSHRAQVQPERQLMVGWSEKGALIVGDYARFLCEGSSIDVLVEADEGEVEEALTTLRLKHPGIEIALRRGDARDPALLVELQPERYDNVILLAGDGETAEEMDAATLALLLTFRQYFQRITAASGAPVATQLITEVMDSDNAELVVQSGVNDFLISNQFVSKVCAQVSQDPDVMRVYDDLFSPEGSEIYIKPVHLYFATLPAEVSFADVMLAAQLRGEVCFGHKVGAEEGDANKSYGVHLIPRRDERLRLVAGDALIVLAEDET
jgi:ion channel POLLUX/CASTOR